MTRHYSVNNPSAALSGDENQRLNPVFVAAWLVCVLFYFTQYGMRSAPGIMLPELEQALNATSGTITSIIGLYFYTYALSALVSGLLLDRIGPRRVVPAGILLLALGAILFGLGSVFAASLGRLLQGAGSGVAFTGAVYLATRGFPRQWLATAVGVTQCFGMLGGSIGQSVVGPLIHSVIGWQQFWFFAGGVLVLMSMAMLAVTPGNRRPVPIEAADGSERESLLEPYKVVLRNPHSYLCGIVSGLMFMPTNIADMIWGIPFLEQAQGVSYEQAVTRISMIPLGWVIGAPLLGYIADALGRRKPVLIGGIVLMLVFGATIVYLPSGSTPPYVMGLLFGVASGAAMIPYTMIKELNPDRVKGTATGTINFIVFASSAVATPIIGNFIGHLSGTGDLTVALFREVDMIYVAGLVLAIVLTFFIRESGTGRPPRVHTVDP
ncbi:MFS transporter [Salinicola peritrichatus]|uniref:MFS transporter n=1 Tax=Salinicola peritrichatus TaxID=1267424 RepID=UPI000DA12315|nr:MFS transporter [Salinicola peritrichatus]